MIGVANHVANLYRSAVLDITPFRSVLSWCQMVSFRLERDFIDVGIAPHLKLSGNMGMIRPLALSDLVALVTLKGSEHVGPTFPGLGLRNMVTSFFIEHLARMRPTLRASIEVGSACPSLSLGRISSISSILSLNDVGHFSSPKSLLWW